MIKEKHRLRLILKLLILRGSHAAKSLNTLLFCSAKIKISKALFNFIVLAGWRGGGCLDLSWYLLRSVKLKNM